MLRRAEKWLLAGFGKFERPAAWVLCAGALATFVGVLTGLIASGEFKLLTLVASASLAFDGYSALRDAYDEADETG